MDFFPTTTTKIPSLVPVVKSQEPSQNRNDLWVSEESYWEHYYDHPEANYEWNNGYLEEKPVSSNATYLMYKWLLMLLHCYLEARPIAKMAGLEMGFRLQLPNRKVKIRKPDLGVVLNSNPVPLLPDDPRYDGIFDLCVEALSTTTRQAIERDTIHKKQDYAQIGVKEYYILSAGQKRPLFYQLNQWGVYEPIAPVAGDVIQSQVLPGFQFRIADLYHQPEQKFLVEDELYRDFVLPSYYAQVQRAEHAENRAIEAEKKALQAQRQIQEAEEKALQAALAAEIERQQKQEAEKKAQQALERAERFAAKLRELGIAVD